MSLLSQCSDEDFIIIVKSSNSIAECERKLGYNAYSGSVNIKIQERISALNIDTSHFINKQKHDWKNENIFVKDSEAVQSTLRKYYIKGNYTEYKCSICGQEPFWNNKELTLILDHINGNNKDDRLENLRWVCPNCNAQLETTGSKNQAYKTEKIKNKCIDCGAEISSTATRCNICYGKSRVSYSMPVSREKLKTLIRTTPFTTIGKMYYVSDNTIRKWCIKYNLPHKAKEIKQYSDFEWSKI